MVRHEHSRSRVPRRVKIEDTGAGMDYLVPGREGGGGMIVGERIEVDPKVMMGKPVIRGTRVTVEADLLGAYLRLRRDDIQAAIRFAADTVAHEETRPIPSGGTKTRVRVGTSSRRRTL
jgi:uncharacterized protein (DUF433 family)